MKRVVSVLLCAAMVFALCSVGAVVPQAATGGIDFLRQSALECVGATAELSDGVLTVTATAADQEIGLVGYEQANLNDYPYWEGTVQSDVPFDIVFYDKNNKKWIYASANFCYEFENHNGASNPLPAGRHDVAFSITGAYTWQNEALPANAAICSIIFILRAPGTLTVERCAMTDGNGVTAYPDTVFHMENGMIKSIPQKTTVSAFCADARLQFDAFKASVNKNADDYIGTGDVVTLNNGNCTTTYTAVVRGDLDASGTATTSDVRRLLAYSVDPSVLNAAQQAAADVLTDQKVNTNDARTLLMQSLNPPAMQFVQERVVGTETYLSETKYETFLSTASRDAVVAGMADNLVPQGLAHNPKTGMTYMSAYASDGSNSVILAYDGNGKFCAEYVIYKANGSPCTAHLGGLAVTDTTLFASFDGDGAYRVAAIPLGSLETKGTQKVYLTTLYEVPVATSFLSYYDGYLWMGNFYLPSSGYDLMRILNFTTTAGSEQYGCYIAGYDLSAQGTARLAPASGQTYATPDVLMAAPQKVQGMVFDTKTNTVILSHSYGRKNDSSLAFYTVNLNGKADTAITLNGTAVPCFLLMNSKKQVKALPMSEGIALTGDGAVKVLFESCANKYSDGLHRTDYIWDYRY